MSVLTEYVAGARPSAVVFDCDGVLVDSEPASEEAWRRTVEEFGGRLEPTDFARWIGRTDAEVGRHYAEVLGVPAEDLDRRARDHLIAVLDGGIGTFDDAVEAVHLVRRQEIPLAVASNSPRWRLDAVMAAAGLSDLLSRSVGGDEVPHPKPAPFVYLEAAAGLGVSPADCLAIEDSPTGVQSASRAGMTVIAVDRGVFAPDRLTGAYRVVRSST